MHINFVFDCDVMIDSVCEMDDREADGNNNLECQVKSGADLICV